MKPKTLMIIFFALVILAMISSSTLLFAGALGLGVGMDFGNEAPEEETPLIPASSCGANFLAKAREIDKSPTQYSQDKRRDIEEGYYDCSSFVSTVYGFSGFPDTRFIANNYEKLGLVQVPRNQLLAGDIVLFHLHKDPETGSIEKDTRKRSYVVNGVPKVENVPIAHAAIFVKEASPGKMTIIDASKTEKGVSERDFPDTYFFSGYRLKKCEAQVAAQLYLSFLGR
jgi:hypothetical protein